jgi:hypothetical protein
LLAHRGQSPPAGLAPGQEWPHGQAHTPKGGIEDAPVATTLSRGASLLLRAEKSEARIQKSAEERAESWRRTLRIG